MNDEKQQFRSGMDHSDPSVLVSKQDDTKMPDTVPDHSKGVAAQITAMTPEEYAEAERKLLRKLDFKLIPWMT